MNGDWKGKKQKLKNTGLIIYIVYNHGAISCHAKYFVNNNSFYNLIHSWEMQIQFFLCLKPKTCPLFLANYNNVECLLNTLYYWWCWNIWHKFKCTIHKEFTLKECDFLHYFFQGYELTFHDQDLLIPCIYWYGWLSSNSNDKITL